MASFEFSFPTIHAGTTFVFGSWVCVANGLGGFSNHLVNPTSTETSWQEQLGKNTPAEILLPEIAEEIENLSLSDMTSTPFPFELRNSTTSYSALLQKNLTRTRTAPQFDSYPDSNDDFDLNSDLLNLTILAMPRSRVVYWKNSESANAFSNAWLVACLLLTLTDDHFQAST